jgi:aminoglycoside phosphotransferase (APT) family kinase protein
VSESAGDAVIDEPLVRALLMEQHPDLAHLPLTRVDAGWDNVLWRLGEELAVRLPRRMTAAWLTDRELRWLPEIAPRLPLPVPVAVRTGWPGCGYLWRWAIVPWLDGEPGDREAITDAASATVLARFLRALHESAPSDAPHNPFRGSVPLVNQSEDFERNLHEVSDHVDVGRVRQVWDDATSAPLWESAPQWLHADLHPANVMVTAGSLTGVVDFGDMCAGDPANDLSAGWTLLPAEALPGFLSAYGDIDEATYLRARGWALRCGVSLISIGLAGERGLPGGKPSWLAGGIATIDRLLSSG